MFSIRGGQGKPGVEDGPVHLVQAGLLEDLNKLGYTINFDEHISFDDIAEEINEPKDPKIGRMRRPRLVSKACEKVYGIVEDHAKAGNIVLTLGGDHSLVGLSPEDTTARKC